jgi:uncharacterized membrane protein YdbT with pleckstrin-like domain
MTYLRRLLSEDETILFITHRHWFVPFSRILAEIVMLLLIVAAVAVVPQLFPDIRPDLIMLGAVLLAVFAVTSALIDILRWHTEQFIVTDRRVIQLEGIFSKTVLNSSLEKITDVELRQSWLGRIFDYGDLEILTASEEAVNQMRSIARPLEFKRAMQDAQARLYGYRQRPISRSYDTAGDVQALLEQLAELRDRGILTPAEFETKKRELLSRI